MSFNIHNKIKKERKRKNDAVQTFMENQGTLLNYKSKSDKEESAKNPSFGI